LKKKTKYYFKALSSSAETTFLPNDYIMLVSKLPLNFGVFVGIGKAASFSSLVGKTSHVSWIWCAKFRKCMNVLRKAIPYAMKVCPGYEN
jgi:hypothetical protein